MKSLKKRLYTETSIKFPEETKVSISGGILPLPDKCGGQWRLPAECDPTNHTSCDYVASWQYLGQVRGKDSVRFTISTKQTKHWTGIGFSDNKKMVSLLMNWAYNIDAK